MADYAGASLHGALGIMLALFARERTGRGQHVDVSYLYTTVSLLAATPNMRFFFSDGLAPRRGEGFLGGSYPYYAIYETRDGKLLTVGCTEPWLWENFCNAIGRPAFMRFARTSDQLVHTIRPAKAFEAPSVVSGERLVVPADGPANLVAQRIDAPRRVVRGRDAARDPIAEPAEFAELRGDRPRAGPCLSLELEQA